MERILLPETFSSPLLLLPLASYTTSFSLQLPFYFNKDVHRHASSLTISLLPLSKNEALALSDPLSYPRVLAYSERYWHVQTILLALLPNGVVGASPLVDPSISSVFGASHMHFPTSPAFLLSPSSLLQLSLFERVFVQKPSVPPPPLRNLLANTGVRFLPSLALHRRSDSRGGIYMTEDHQERGKWRGVCSRALGPLLQFLLLRGGVLERERGSL